MRAIRGAAPGASIAEMWGALRDDPGLASNYGDQVAAARARVDYAAPSRAHKRRLLRVRPTVTPCDPPRVPLAMPATIGWLRGQLGKLSQPEPPAPQPAMSYDGIRKVFDRTANLAERGTPRPLDADQLALRARQRAAERVRMAGFGIDAAVRAWRLYA